MSIFTTVGIVKIGYLSLNHAAGIRPDHLATELETRGFDSLWVPEHSHIPTSRATAYPAGGELPEGYLHNMDPFVSLTAAAGASTDLLLYTGVCLILEQDLLNLACKTATLDVLSNGRFRLGIGVGWNEEELANHRPDLPFAKRYSAMRERVEALRTAWADERASFSGERDRFSESWIYPKPTGGSIPIALGNAGPVGITHAASYGNEWCPIDASLAVADGGVKGAFQQFHDAVEAEGRDPKDIPISIFMTHPRPDRMEIYAELGAERVVLFPPTMALHDTDATLRHLDDITDALPLTT